MFEEKLGIYHFVFEQWTDKFLKLGIQIQTVLLIYVALELVVLPPNNL